MDPNQTFFDLLIALGSGDPDAATEAAQDLADWIARDGFEPGALASCIVLASQGRI